MLFVYLCFDLGPVLEGDGNPCILGDGHIIDHRQPVLISEDRQRLSLLQTCQHVGACHTKETINLFIIPLG